MKLLRMMQSVGNVSTRTHYVSHFTEGEGNTKLTSTQCQHWPHKPLLPEHPRETTTLSEVESVFRHSRTKGKEDDGRLTEKDGVELELDVHNDMQGIMNEMTGAIRKEH